MPRGHRKRFKRESDMQLDSDDPPHPHPFVRPSSLTLQVVSLSDAMTPYTIDPSSPLREIAEAAFDDEPVRLRPHLHLVFARGRSHFTPDALLGGEDLDGLTVGDFVGRNAAGFQFFVVALITVQGVTAEREQTEDTAQVVISSWTRIREVRDQVKAAWTLNGEEVEEDDDSLTLFFDALCTHELPPSTLPFAWHWGVDGHGGCIYGCAGPRPPVLIGEMFHVTLLNGMKGTTGRNLEVEVSGETTVLEIKKKIRSEHSIATSHQMVFFDGEEMEDKRTLSHYKVGDGAVLQLKCQCL